MLTRSDGTISEYEGVRLCDPLDSAVELRRIEVHAPGDLNVWTPIVFEPPASSLEARWTPLAAQASHWWHDLHGIDVEASDRGEGVRIGVIDEGLHPAVVSELASDRFIYVGALPWREGPHHDGRAYDPITDHSEWISKILGAADRSTLPRSIAPGATLMVASAANDERGVLDVDRVANALDFLVAERCDLVMISAGDVLAQKDIQPLETAMQVGADAGTLCLVAAGNLGGTPLWPAASSSCVSVTAAGLRGVAPLNSWEAHEESVASDWLTPDLFLCNSSAKGAGVDVVAAGVGIILRQCDGRMVAVSGTSFACPVATGALAVKLSGDADYLCLPRDATRSRYARRVLEDMCEWFPGVAFGWPRL
ncbi:MAG: hypothetical protein EA417_00865 [Gammaproteobacteria bacterium]|nr:MAG: hypothetical protein EA417_00865 [Gammaproteobacteria bacterium]